MTVKEVRGVKPRFIDAESRKPLAGMFLYVMHKKVPGESWEYELNENGQTSKRIIVGETGSDYQFFVSAFKLIGIEKDNKGKDNYRILTIFANIFLIDKTESFIKHIRNTLTFVAFEEHLNKTEVLTPKRLTINSDDITIELPLTNVHKELFDFKSALNERNVDKDTPWIKIDSMILYKQTWETAINPFLVNQYNTPTCGPACIEVFLAYKEPERFVKLVHELFITGKIEKPKIMPRASLLNSESRTRDLDWMFLGSLRDNENLFFDINSNFGIPQGIAGMTTPSTVKKWSENILNMRADSKLMSLENEIQDDILRMNEIKINVIKDADAKVNFNENSRMGKTAFLLIDADMLGPKEAWLDLINHWIVFLGELDVKDDTVSFNYFSWGKVERKLELPRKRFLKSFFEAVIVEP